MQGDEGRPSMAVVHQRLNSMIIGRIKKGKYGGMDDEEERDRFFIQFGGLSSGREVGVPATVGFGREGEERRT